MSEATTLAIADGVKLVKNVRIPMRDSVRLAADLYMPDNGYGTEQWPIVMEYTPYRKDDVDLSARPGYLFLPRHGYVVARVDIRGTGASEGVSTDEYTTQEQLDGHDAVEWLAQQPWCDGHVNMMGISYGGFTALQVAAQAPPHLTSIIPIHFTDDRYTDDCHYRGGLLRKYYDIAHYGGLMVARNAMPPYPEWSGGEWADVWRQHLAHNEPYLLKWYGHQTDGEYWRSGSVGDAPERIQCPAFLIGGWRDGYPNPPLRLFEALKVPRKVLIGPWNHALPDAAIPGPRIDYLHEVVRWLETWCRGKNTGIMEEPPIVVYMQHYQAPEPDRLDTAGEWRAETGWPPPGAREEVLYLDKDQSLQDRRRAAGDQDEASDSFTYDPTVGVAGGLWSGGIPFGLPGDQRRDEAFSLVYSTPPLEKEVRILGWPRAILHVSSTATVIGFAVSLSDVAPDGTSHLVAKGMMNATRRTSLTDAKPVAPGEVFELHIEIDCTSWMFASGHRIRLSIASADWPNVWPTPEPATNQVYRGARHPSRLILPVVPAKGSAAAPLLHRSPRSAMAPSAATHPPTWKVCQDQLTGRMMVEIRHGAEARVNDTTVIERESSSTFDVNPIRPSDASARGRHLVRIIRPNQVTQSQADIAVQATGTHFHLEIRLVVQVNGAQHFAKQWVESVPRDSL